MKARKALQPQKHSSHNFLHHWGHQPLDTNPRSHTAQRTVQTAQNRTASLAHSRSMRHGNARTRDGPDSTRIANHQDGLMRRLGGQEEGSSDMLVSPACCRPTGRRQMPHAVTHRLFTIGLLLQRNPHSSLLRQILHTPASADAGCLELHPPFTNELFCTFSRLYMLYTAKRN